MATYNDYRGSIATTSPTPLKISTSLDAIRNYQFEVDFRNIPALGDFKEGDLQIGVNKVTAYGPKMDMVEIHRVNDIVKYPGKMKFEPITVTFDNQLLIPHYAHLWEYIKSVYNPLTGQYHSPATGARNIATLKAARLIVRQLSGQNTPISETTFWGVFPIEYAIAEQKYADTNVINTIDVKFSFDTMDIRTISKPQ
jgi:hypothetical protein